MARGVSIRLHIVAIILLGAIIPLSMVGAWLTLSSVRSGRDLLRQHLVAAADRLVAATESRWQYRVEDLQLLAQNDVSQRAARGDALAAADFAYLAQLSGEIGSWVTSATLTDSAGHVRWTASTNAAPTNRPGSQTSTALLGIRIPILAQGDVILGSLDVLARLGAIIPADSGRPLVTGSRVALRQIGSGQLVLAFDPAVGFPVQDEITLDGAVWLTVRRVVTGPGLEVAVGAPLSSYVAPFTRAARIGMTAVAVVTLFALLLTTFLATRLTTPIVTLADAADAVAGGDLGHRVDSTGPAELRRLGNSFNVMTNSLRRTLDELSQRSALAAVGEFATSLSHEVRNALTSIKVDLQRASRRTPGDPVALELVVRALNNVSRLDSAVSGSLRVARGARGELERERLDLREVLTCAADAVLGAYSEVPASMTLALGETVMWVDGDRSALEQLFVNLFFNAGQAVSADGSVVVRLERIGRMLVTAIADDGVGMTPNALERLSHQAYTSKAHGTGLGLPIARHIAAAHGGDLRILSAPHMGTTVCVELPSSEPM